MTTQTTKLDHQKTLAWLRADDEVRLEQLWYMADQTRRRHVGHAVHRRGLIEISNRCDRHCLYCGIRSANDGVRRYSMSADEIMDCVRLAARLNYGTVVLQSGESASLNIDWLVGLVRRIKRETSLAVTLSLGERSDDDLAQLKGAGADRYLLRFETSNPDLYDRIHPPAAGLPRRRRIEILTVLRQLGYEVGSGVMIGIPGQTYEDLARDIGMFAELDLDMIGVGPYIPHPDTPLVVAQPDSRRAPDQQVPNSEQMTYKVLALSRLVCPLANIPSTTALATLNPQDGRELGLERGANVVMPNLTPRRYRSDYEIYPNKVCLTEGFDPGPTSLEERIRAIGRTLAMGPGDSPNIVQRRTAVRA